MRTAKAARIVCLASLLVPAALPATAASVAADGWIGHPDTAATPEVLHFRRELELARVPRELPVTVTADNRFVLYVNGKRLASGPSTGTIGRWRYGSVNLAPLLRPGHNVIAAAVWNFGAAAPLAQHSVATGFRLVGAGVSTGDGSWRVQRDAGHTAVTVNQLAPQYYVASTPEIIDASKASWNWAGAREPGEDWRDAVPVPKAAERTLIADPLPAQAFTPAAPGITVRSTLPDARAFPARPVTIPAHSVAKLLLRRDAMISAYPELEVAGGKGARIKLAYTEALYDAQGQRGRRDLYEGRKVVGFFDTFITDGATRTFAPLWWRTWRFVELDIVTQQEPLTLRAFRVNETGYPFRQIAHFESSDPELDRIWNIGWRTLRIDAHETFMDSSYWEQLQYGGDTRLEMLITYSVSGDARLALQAIDAFADSDVHGGLIQGAYPSRGDNVIATFSLAWIGMLADWSMQQPDPAPIVRHLPRIRIILDWFGKLQNARGLLGPNPHWNFIDWSGQRWDDRTVFPSYGKTGGSCLMTVMWLGALTQAAALEAAYGEQSAAAADTQRATAARAAIREHCWDAERGLFADNPDRDVFSQHMNTLAVLYDAATRAEAPGILDRITVRGKGIEAPPDMFASTYYFAWYIARAFEHAGLNARYVDLLSSWRHLLALEFTTRPESLAHPRSDTHAWSAHPTADLLSIVAGIRSAARGFARLRIEPALGSLTSLSATAATPHGVVSVRYRIADGLLEAAIDRPAALPGEFVWRGKTYALTRLHTVITAPAAAN